jgi:hypothetical protein
MKHGTVGGFTRGKPLPFVLRVRNCLLHVSEGVSPGKLRDSETNPRSLNTGL